MNNFKHRVLWIEPNNTAAQKCASVLPGCNNIFAFMIIFKKLFHYVSSLSSSHPSCLGRAGGHSLLFRGRPLRATADSEPYRSTGKVNVEWYLTLYPKTRVQRASC